MMLRDVTMDSTCENQEPNGCQLRLFCLTDRLSRARLPEHVDFVLPIADEQLGVMRSYVEKSFLNCFYLARPAVHVVVIRSEGILVVACEMYLRGQMMFVEQRTGGLDQTSIEFDAEGVVAQDFGQPDDDPQAATPLTEHPLGEVR